MLQRIVLALLLILLLAYHQTAFAQENDWVALFNGVNLDGWMVKCLPEDCDKTFWTVEDSAIVLNSIGQADHDYVWLVTEKEYDDFELRLRFQGYRDSPGNSGIQVRSRYDDSPDAPRGGWLDGPQIDIHPPTPWRIGLIYDETREERRWIAPSLPDWNIDDSYAPEGWRFSYADEGDGWNELRIICEGTRIQTLLNGVVMADYDGRGVLDNEAHQQHNVGLTGHIALQLHSNDEVHIRFKDIHVREL